ncbi:MAG: PEP-CTERM sorting domain-containing protein [Planctomycetota bacterium]|nr:PEP-CTERM sorting domain-containing protein [Planctomycetota bacterium]
MRQTKVWVMLAMTLAVLGGRAWAAGPAPFWAEEASTPVSSSRWGPWGGSNNGKANGAYRNDVAQITDPGDASNGLFNIASGLGGGSGNGMAVIEFGDGALLETSGDFIGAIVGPGPLRDVRDYTLEMRFQIAEDFDSFAYDAPGYNSNPVSLLLEDNLHEPIQMDFGYRNNNPTTGGPAINTPEYDANITNVAYNIGSDYTITPSASTTDYQAHTGVWQTVRIVSDYSGTGTEVVGTGCLSPDSAGTLKVYLNGVLQRVETNVGRDGLPISAGASFDYANGFACKDAGGNILGIGKARRGRGFVVRRGDNGGGGTSREEINIDYIRVWHEALPLVETCAGNLNGDNTTDGADVAIIYNAWGTNNAQADITGDGIVDGADLAEVFNCWGQADVGPTAVPEPASFGMIGLGLAGLLAARRRS